MANLHDDSTREVRFIRSAADLVFALDNTDDSLAGLQGETVSDMMARIIESADRVDAQLGQLGEPEAPTRAATGHK